MADAIVRAQALRWVSDDQPGWIEVGLVDADGQEHRIIDKVPVLTSRSITASALWSGCVSEIDGTSRCVGRQSAMIAANCARAD